MAKLDLGIIAVLGLGVGAFALSRMKGKQTQPTTTQPTITQPAPPESIIPTDSPVTSGSGQTAVFPNIGDVTLPVQVEGTTPSVSTPIPDENVDEVIDTIFGGELDEGSKSGIVEQATKIIISEIRLYGYIGQIDINETIKVFANVNTNVGVLNYSWDFGDGKKTSGTDLQYTSHSYKKSGRQTIKLTVTSHHGVSATKSINFNVIPEPIKQGVVTAKVFAQTNSAIVRLLSNHSKGMSGTYTINLTGANVRRLSGSQYINPKSYTQISISGLKKGNTRFDVDFKPKGSSSDVIIHGSETVFIHDENVNTQTPSEPKPTPNTPTNTFKGIVAKSGFLKYHPKALLSTYLLINYRPSKIKKLKYARIYFKGKADNFGLAGAKAVIKFNGSIIGTLKWSAGEDYKPKVLDVKVTSKIKENSFNKCDVTYIHNNQIFGQPLDSGFTIDGSDLYMEYEY